MGRKEGREEKAEVRERDFKVPIKHSLYNLPEKMSNDFFFLIGNLIVFRF